MSQPVYDDKHNLIGYIGSKFEGGEQYLQIYDEDGSVAGYLDKEYYTPGPHVFPPQISYNLHNLQLQSLFLLIFQTLRKVGHLDFTKE